MRKKSEMSASLDKYLNFCVSRDSSVDIQTAKTEIVRRLFNFLLQEVQKQFIEYLIAKLEDL